MLKKYINRACLGALSLCLVGASIGCSSSKPKPDKMGLSAGQAGTAPSKNAKKAFEDAVKEYESGDCKGAISDLEDAIDDSPVFPKAWFNMGVCAEKLGDKDKALEYYEKSASQSARLAAPHVNLGMKALAENRRDDAMDQFSQAVEKNKYHPQAQNNLSVMKRERGEYKEAVVHARQSLAGDSRNTGAYANLALIYYKMGYNDVAKLVVLNALKISKDNADVWNTFGIVELANKDVTSAVRHFQAAIKLNDKHVEALMNLAAIKLSVRDYDEAIKLFERVLTIEPKNYDARISVAVARRGKGDLKAAEGEYKAVLKEDENNAMALFNLGVLYHEHLSQATMQGEGQAAPPQDPVENMKWTQKNMKAVVKHYEEAKEYYRRFQNAYTSPKGGEDERFQDSERRLSQLDELIRATFEQVQLMDDQIVEVAAAMEAQKEAQAQQKEQEALEKQQAKEGKKSPSGDDLK